VVPGSIVIKKADATTGDPLAGAIFDVRYDSANDGTYDQDLGDCTTTAAGTCSPTPNDGTGYLPGHYEVTEIAAPTGYYLPTPTPVQTVTVAPGATATVSFTDPLLVPASFEKVATGNVNPTQLVLAGAVIDVTAGTSYGGTPVATCTTDASGKCSTAAMLISGQPYCWEEVTAPVGLAAGATGCFVATNAQGAEPITVTDPGEFVGVNVKKVDAANPSAVLAGATFDLYRQDNGTGPNAPTPSSGAPTEAGQTWVARATSGTNGMATFPLQLPGYAYCAVESSAPANYEPNTTEQCTGVLSGSTSVPASITTITVSDTEARVVVGAHKFNSATPNTTISGAVYDLYVQGAGPPSGPPSAPPSGAATESGDQWWARGTTGSSGTLTFTVPAGYAWCFREVTAPMNYSLDTGLHCTPVINSSSPKATSVVALPETLAMVQVYAHKFDSMNPNTYVPGATYALVGQGTVPPGWSAAANPNGYAVPAGDWYYGTATTNQQGDASWTVPAGYSWCLHEVNAPASYLVDTAWHCTPVVTTATATAAATMALPEVPKSTPPVPVLPFTGAPTLWQLGIGITLVGVGGLLLVVGRRRKKTAEPVPSTADS
jgi:uncharacterized surface anchored protein